MSVFADGHSNGFATMDRMAENSFDVPSKCVASALMLKIQSCDELL